MPEPHPQIVKRQRPGDPDAESQLPLPQVKARRAQRRAEALERAIKRTRKNRLDIGSVAGTSFIRSRENGRAEKTRTHTQPLLVQGRTGYLQGWESSISCASKVQTKNAEIEENSRQKRCLGGKIISTSVQVQRSKW